MAGSFRLGNKMGRRSYEQNLDAFSSSNWIGGQSPHLIVFFLQHPSNNPEKPRDA